MTECYQGEPLSGWTVALAEISRNGSTVISSDRRVTQREVRPQRLLVTSVLAQLAEVVARVM